MAQEITIPALKEKIGKVQDEIANLLYTLQKETGIVINGISIFKLQNEVARDKNLELKIEYTL